MTYVSVFTWLILIVGSIITSMRCPATPPTPGYCIRERMHATPLCRDASRALRKLFSCIAWLRTCEWQAATQWRHANPLHHSDAITLRHCRLLQCVEKSLSTRGCTVQVNLHACWVFLFADTFLSFLRNNLKAYVFFYFPDIFYDWKKALQPKKNSMVVFFSRELILSHV